MSLASHRKYYIDEIIKLTSTNREVLRKFTIPTLSKMLDDLKRGVKR